MTSKCVVTADNEHRYVPVFFEKSEDHFVCTECGDYMIQYVDGQR